MVTNKGGCRPPRPRGTLSSVEGHDAGCRSRSRAGLSPRPYRARSRPAEAQTTQEPAVVAFHDNGSLSVIDRDGTSERVVAGSGVEIPSWSPDGKLLAIQSDGLALLSVEDGSIRTIAPGPASGASFSPDGKWVVYSTGLDKPVLRIAGVDGSGNRMLYDDPVCPAVFPLWSPAGDWIAFAHQGYSSCGGTASIRPDGSSYRLLDADNNGRVTWSPSGREIAITTYPGVRLVAPDGSAKRTIHADLQVWNLDWSRDGRLVFPVWDGTQADLFASRSDGSALERLTTTPDRNEDWVSWSPDTRSVAFASSPVSGHADPAIAVYDIDTRTIRELARRPRAHFPMFRPVIGAIHRPVASQPPTAAAPSPSPSEDQTATEQAAPLAAPSGPFADTTTAPPKDSRGSAPRAGVTRDPRPGTAPVAPTTSEAAAAGSSALDMGVEPLAAERPTPAAASEDEVNMDPTVASGSSTPGWLLASGALGLGLVATSLGFRRRHRQRASGPSTVAGPRDLLTAESS